MELSPIAPGGLAPAAKDSEAAAAGRQFEALIIRQLLAGARPEATGPEAEWRSIADTALADQLATHAPLGIAMLLARAATQSPQTGSTTE